MRRIVSLPEIVSYSQKQVWYKEFIITSVNQVLHPALHNRSTKWKVSIADIQFNPISMVTGSYCKIRPTKIYLKLLQNVIIWTRRPAIMTGLSSGGFLPCLKVTALTVAQIRQ